MGARIFIFCIGCPRRYLDASRLSKYFMLNGCEITKNAKKADYLIYVTCSFKKTEEEECFKYIRKFSRYRGELIVVGCLPAIAPSRLKQEFQGRSLITRDLDKIDDLFPDFRVKFSETEDANEIIFKPLSFYIQLYLWIKKLLVKSELARKLLKRYFPFACTNMLNRREYPHIDAAYLRISDGCIGNCTYCSDREAIGKLRSKPIAICQQEYKNLLEKGHRKFVFIADNLGIYGLDCNSSLAQLFQALSETDRGIKVSWHLQHLHPRWLMKFKAELLELVKENKIESIICPIQSGSNRVLKLMNRHYNIEEVTDNLLQLKAANANLQIYTHIMIGFPSETENDFLATLQALKDIRFYHVALFPYYDCYDTVASKMGDKVDKKTIFERVKRTIDFLNRENLSWHCNDVSYIRYLTGIDIFEDKPAADAINAIQP